VLAVNQKSSNNRQLFRTDDGKIAWIADVPESSDKYLALFNVSNATQSVSAKVADLGLKADVKVNDLWTGKALEDAKDEVSAEIPAHGAKLYRVSGK
jgi:alpha-galactosidase